MKTEEPREYSLQLVDKFGNLHKYKIHRYEYAYGTIQLFRSSVGVIVETIDDGELRSAQMELIAVFTDIGGFWVTEGEDAEG